MSERLDKLEKIFVSDYPDSTMACISLKDAEILDGLLTEAETKIQILEIQVRTFEKEIEYYHGRINS